MCVIVAGNVGLGSKGYYAIGEVGQFGSNFWGEIGDAQCFIQE